MTGTTKSGFEFEITDDALDDWEALELLEEMEAGENPLAMISFAKKIFGAEQYKRFKEHVKKSNNGKMPIEATSNELLEVMRASDETKN